MTGDVRPQGDGKALAEKDVAVLGTFSVVDPDLVVIQINVSDLNVTHF